MTSNDENMTTNHNQKSALKKKLEELEHEIYNSWLKDQDKVRELTELAELLEKIYEKDSIEEFFNNQGDYEYFCKKFTTEIIQNIMRQHYIIGVNGDEVAGNVFFMYLKIFFKFMEKPQYQTLWDSMKEIFDCNKNYYKGSIYGTNRNFNEKKLISAEKYNETKLSRKIETKMEITEGMELDILIDSKRQTGVQTERKAWVRGRVSRVESEMFVVYVGEDPYPIYLKHNSFEYAPKGAMTKDWEWRTELQPHDNVDCFDRSKWYPGTILYRKEDEINGLKRVEYRIGFRVYPEWLPSWENYRKFWPLKDVNKDAFGRQYLGDVENLDEWIPSYSKRIQKFNSMILAETKQESYENENYFIDDMVKFIDEDGKKHYIIGRNNGFYFYFASVINFFCELGGFEKMIRLLGKSAEDRPSTDLIHNIFSILNIASGLFHKEFIIQLGKDIYENIFKYLNDMSQNELRNMKKETFDLITKVLRFYLGLSLGSEQSKRVIEQFSIAFAIKMIKTSFLEKRITAIKTIIDVIKSTKNDPNKRIQVLKLIEENQIFYEIYGPNSHIQLINKSKDLLEIMLQEDKLSNGEMEMIWGATKKGDLEGKLTILKTLKEISSSLQPKHITVLLDNIYSSKRNELINDEIDLIYDLSTHKSQSEETLEKCIKFFTSCLLENRSDEGEKIEILINKIFEITKFNPSFKTSVINMTTESLEKNENVNLALKILQKYLRDSDLESDYDLNRLFIDNNNLVKLFCANFVKYIQFVGEKAKSWTQDIDLLPLRDNFSHTQNVKARLNFLNTLLTLKLWKVEEDPIDFVYKTLIEEGSISEKDKNEFFNWIKNSIEKNADYETEEKVFKLFIHKLCNDTKSCQNLSIDAFDTYLKVFLDINSQNGNLRYTKIPREGGVELDVYIEPEKLIGFQILWKIVFESFSSDIMNKGIETLHKIFTNVQIKAELDVIESATQSYSQLLLKKCINLIKETNENSNNTVDEKKNIITKCLIVLKLMIEESEKRGTARVRSHAGILKKRIVEIKVNSSAGVLTNREFVLKVYGNTTIWELKELISSRLEYCFDFLKIVIVKENYELKNTDNGKTLIDFNLEDGDEIRCSANGLEKLITQVDIVTSQGYPTEEISAIFNSWFDRFASSEKMSKEDCTKFIKAVTSTREDITTDDHRINYLFGTYDKNKDDLLEREEFTAFYLECTIKPEKRKIVWDNLKTMGYRNDLKKISEPYQIYNEDKTILPRYQLSHNEEFFNTLFYLQDLNDDIAKESFEFLCIICTNPTIFKQILLAGDETDWNVLLNESNIYKLIYSLQIIESFLEDIELNSQNINAVSGESNILEGTSEEELKEKKMEWIRIFVEKGGYSHLVNILQNKLVLLVDQLMKKEQMSNSLMNNICIEFLLKIVRIFYFSSLNKYPSYKKTMKQLTKQFSGLSISNQEPDNEFIKKESTEGAKLVRLSSVQIDLNTLEMCFVNGGLGEFILKSLDHDSIISNLINLSYNLINKEVKTKQELVIINTSFEFLTVIIPFAPEYDKVEHSIISSKNFVNVSLYGLLNSTNSVRVIFSNSLIKLCKLLQASNKYEIIVYFFLHIFELIENISKDLEKNSNELFEFFSYLLEIYLNDNSKFTSLKNGKEITEINPQKFLKKMLDNLEDDINEDPRKATKSISLSNELLIGYMKIVTKVAETNMEIKNLISNNYNLIQGVLTKVLFKQNSEEIKDRLAKYEYINPDKIDDSKSNRNSNQQIRNVCYNFILSMLKDSIENFEQFFSVNVLESENNPKKEEKSNEKSYSRIYFRSNQGRNEGHVGLYNLGFICYMNSMMQQFFMVPSLRYALLKVKDSIEPSLNNPNNIDDNSLHQVQRMFSYLELSERMDYNPFGFCYSFKDWEGNPTNTGVQQDAQEFLSRFLDAIENQIKPTNYKYLLNSIFGGKTCSQLICEEGCGVARNRYEDFLTLSLEVNNMKNLQDSLEKLISAEKIDDYNCDTCKRKVSITKRNSLAQLPNVLIVHLQRLFYNYEYDRNEKINSRLEFPKVLNLKDYCLEEITRRNAAKKAKEGDEEIKLENLETDEIYFKHPSYYEYYLVGVVVHMGSADSGHYYSFINTIRGGNENESNFNPKDESHVNSWLEFNDSYVSKFNLSKLEDECYGGSYDTDKDRVESTSWGNFNRGEKTKSAYMLVYERRIKSPIKVVIEAPSLSNNLVSFKEEELAKIKKEFDMTRFNMDSQEYNTIKEKLHSSVFFDVAKNEYFTYEPFYTRERLIPKTYYLDIVEDNSLLQKHQNISDERFVSFFDNVINLLDEAMSNLKEIKPETSVKISITFMNFIFNILSQKDKQQLLKAAKEKFLHILSSQPACLVPVWEYINEHQKQLSDILLNENETVVHNNSELIYELIKMVYNTSPKTFMETLAKNDYEDNMYSYAKKTIEYLISMFPRVSNKLVAKTGPVIKLLRDISLLNKELLVYFSHKEIVFTFVTFLLGRDSPCYSETLLKQGDNWDYGRPIIQGFEPIVELIYEIFVYSKENKLRNETMELECVLSMRDLKCLKNPNFLKFIFKNCDKIFSGLLVNLNYEDEEFTLQSCVEITRYIDEIYLYNGHDFVKLFTAIIPLLSLKDSYQRTRFEIIIGIPQITMDDTGGRYPFPLIGYHNLGDDRGKYIDHKGTVNLRGMCCVIKKMFMLKLKDTYSVQIFLAMLDTSAENHHLLKYIRKMPAEEPVFESFIEYGVALVNAYGKNEQNIFYERLKEIVSRINPILDKVMNDPEILPGQRGFLGRYVIKNIKREEITLIKQKDNIYLFQLEYFANTLSLNNPIDYSESKSFVGGNVNLLEDDEKNKKEEEEVIIDENENLKDVPEDVQLVSSDTKINLSEKEFFKKILMNFTTYKKVIVENRHSVPNFTSVLKRYIVFNNAARDANIDFKLKRLSTPQYEDINEYVPSSCFSLYIPSQMIRNVYLMPKLSPEKDWCDGGMLDFELDAEWVNYKGMYTNSYGNYSGVTNTPTLINYTEYANYSQNYRAGVSTNYNQVYPSLNIASNYTNVGSNEGNARVPEVDEDYEDENYGNTY